MSKKRFILSQEMRDTIIIICALLAYLAYNVVFKTQTERMYLLTAFAILALILSFIYILTNRPLKKKELRIEIILNCLIIIAMTNFIFKIINPPV